MTKKKVLIIGGSGFLGKQLCVVLVQKGYHVDATIRVLPSKEERHPLVNYILCDMENLLENRKKFHDDYQYIFYMVWLGTDRDSKNNYSLQNQNLLYIETLIKFCVTIRLEKLILMGSAAEYAGNEGGVNLNEFPKVVDTYSAFKSCGRILADFLCRKEDVPYNYVISSTVYGPSNRYDNILSYAIKQLLLGERTSFTKLEQNWNYIYIDDLIEGLLAIAKKGTVNETYVLCSTENKKLYEYIEMVRDMINPSIDLGIGTLPYKMKKIDNMIVDDTKTMIDTGFKSKISFQEGAQRTIKFFRDIMVGEE